MKSSLLIIRRWMAKDDVPMRFTERVWAAARATHSWTYAPSPATSWQPARKKRWERRYGVSGEAVCAGLAIAPAEGHSVLPAVTVMPVEMVQRHGVNSCPPQRTDCARAVGGGCRTVILT